MKHYANDAYHESFRYSAVAVSVRLRATTIVEVTEPFTTSHSALTRRNTAVKRTTKAVCSVAVGGDK